MQTLPRTNRRSFLALCSGAIAALVAAFPRSASSAPVSDPIQYHPTRGTYARTGDTVTFTTTPEPRRVLRLWDGDRLIDELWVGNDPAPDYLTARREYGRRGWYDEGVATGGPIFRFDHTSAPDGRLIYRHYQYVSGPKWWTEPVFPASSPASVTQALAQSAARDLASGMGRL